MLADLKTSGAALAIGARDLTTNQALSPLRVALSKAGIWLADRALGVRLTIR